MKTKPRRIAIVGHTRRVAVRRAASRLVQKLARRGCEVRLDRDLAAAMNRAGEPFDKLGSWCDVMISLGGDGTVLTAGRAIAGRRGVLLPVNLGGLGFLAAAEEDELDEAVDAALAKRWPVGIRSGLETRIRRARGGRDRAVGFALNDAVVRSAVSYAAIHLRVSALGQDLGHLVADGLIASSSSGSTAYTLSAGGPMVAPHMHAMIVTPACAHALGSRSLVLGPGTVLSTRVISPGPALLVLDGQEPIELAKDDEVDIQLAKKTVRVFENPGRPFLFALQSKLGWQGSERRSL
ncbi:MAG: NAD(+)/NADH kinase [Candidatus Eisenbacteria bacterium]|nr:NAD(+)/NADH kinase [Candidatus Eisenbacteria bacterium]